MLLISPLESPSVVKLYSLKKEIAALYSLASAYMVNPETVLISSTRQAATATHLLRLERRPVDPGQGDHPGDQRQGPGRADGLAQIHG